MVHRNLDRQQIDVLDSTGAPRAARIGTWECCRKRAAMYATQSLGAPFARPRIACLETLQAKPLVAYTHAELPEVRLSTSTAPALNPAEHERPRAVRHQTMCVQVPLEEPP